MAIDMPFSNNSTPPFITASRSFRGSVLPTTIGFLDFITSPKSGCFTRLSLTTKVSSLWGPIIQGNIIVSRVLIWLPIKSTEPMDLVIFSMPVIWNIPPVLSINLKISNEESVQAFVSYNFRIASFLVRKTIPAYFKVKYIRLCLSFSMNE